MPPGEGVRSRCASAASSSARRSIPASGSGRGATGARTTGRASSRGRDDTTSRTHAADSCWPSVSVISMGSTLPSASSALARSG